MRVDNWFGSKWAGFAGKSLGAIGVWKDDLVLPPFIPDRIVDSRWFKKAGDDYTEVIESNPHSYQHSSDNMSKKVSRFWPDTAFYWWSGNTAGSPSNTRGSLMAYIPSEDGHYCWYIGFEKKTDWGICHLVEISRQEIDLWLNGKREQV